MIEVLPSPDHVAALKVSGAMTADDFDVVIAEVESRLLRHPRISVLLDLSTFSHSTPRAMLKDIAYDLSKCRQLKRFAKEAIVSRKTWMHVASKLLSPLIPFVQLRAFRPEAYDEALAWAEAIY